MNKHGGYHGDDLNVIDYSVNINPLGMPQWVKGEIENYIEKLYVYPDISGQKTIDFISQWSKVKPKQVILGNGAIELIYLVCRSHQWKKGLIIEPTFNEYRRAMSLYGMEVESLVLTQDRDFRLSLQSLKEVLDESFDCLFICNPNNPTGVGYTKEEMTAFLKEAKAKGVTVIIDESFIDFTEIEPLTDLIDDHKVLLLRSMTKSYGLPGLRMGYALGHESMISAMNKYKEPWSQNAIALDLMPKLLDDHDHIEKTVAFIKKSIEALDDFEFMGWRSKPKANFFLLHLGHASGMELNEYLEPYGYYVRTCNDFVGLDDHYIRITLKDITENKRLFSLINKYLITKGREK